MSTVRNCAKIPLSKKPLALVLGQIKFSPIANISDFIPKIQGSFRKSGFPQLSTQEISVFELGPQGIKKSTALPQWRFETASREAVILVDQEQTTIQTVEYNDFETFIKNFLQVFNTVSKITEHDKYGIINRIGLRYINQIRKQNENDTIESYLRPALQGMDCLQYSNTKKQYSISTIGKTALPCGYDGTLAIRIIRGEPGLDLPPDLLSSAPAARRHIDQNEDIAIIDMDHYWVGSHGPAFDINLIEKIFFQLHDSIIDGLHTSVVSEEGIKKWE